MMLGVHGFLSAEHLVWQVSSVGAWPYNPNLSELLLP